MTIGIRRILLPTDFSEPSLQAAKYAMALAHQFGAELHLLHVVSQIMPYTDDSSSWILPANETQEQLEAAEQRLLASVIDHEWAATHRVVHKTVVGFTVDEILAYAHEHQIDLIVVGTHGYTWMTHTLIGSVAEKVVRAANCPVLTIHPQGHQFLEKTKCDTFAQAKT